MAYSKQQNDSCGSSWSDYLTLFVIFGSLFFILLGTRPLFVPDEGRYAEIAREMIARHDFVTPYLNGIKYFEKPILFYWLGAAAIKIGGLNLWSIRSINATLGLLGVIFTYCTTKKLYDRKTGLLAALILGTSTLYFVMVHMISLDLPVTVFIALCLYSFLLGTQEPQGMRKRLYLWLCAAAAALAVLTKGLIGIVFPGLIIFVWLAILNDWRVLKQLYLPSCILIFLLIAAPWHVLVSQRNPEFFHFYFIEQHFLRYTDKSIGHYQPVWFFIPTLVLGFFPWIVFLPQALCHAIPGWKNRHAQKNTLFFLLWAVLIFVFFSFSKSKLIPYILPVFPPLAILTAIYLKAAIATIHTKVKGVGTASLRIGLFCLVILSGVVSFYLFKFTQTSILPDASKAACYLNTGAGILLVATLLSFLLSFKKPCSAVLLLIPTMWLFLLASLAAMPSIDNRTILPLAQIINAKIQPQDEVVAYDQYYQDLPFYLQRRVTILNWRNEMSYGMKHQNTSDWMITDKVFWQRWNSDKRLFVIMDKDNLDQLKSSNQKAKFFVLGKTVNNVLVSNQE